MVMSRKRRRYIIKKTFQVKYTAIILCFIFLTAFISCAAIYFALYPYLSEKLANVYPQGRLVTVLKNAQINASVSTLILLPLAAWFGIILSHRIAGPWYRLENILKLMAKGNFATEVKLRKNDELHSLADAINDATRNLRETTLKTHDQLEALDSVLGQFEHELGKDPVDIIKTKLLLSKVHETSKELKILSRKYTPEISKK